MIELQSYTEGAWQNGKGDEVDLYDAVSGEVVAKAKRSGLNYKGMLDYARNVGGPALRKMTFHERALKLKALAIYLNSKKEKFYEISRWTGATKGDSWIDIDGGIGVVFTYASKGRRELPNECFYVEGSMEALSKEGKFIGQHICTPLEGAALHINAFNFPCWGMLEKIAPTLLAGVPAIIKPATVSSYLTEAMFKEMIASEIFPKGSLQLIVGSAGDIFDHLTCEDVVTFTGSAETGRKLKVHPKVIENSVRFNMEADSLNCCILGSDIAPDMEEFNLFIKEVSREMTVKAGQKCTAIRRTLVPESHVEVVIEALKSRLSGVVVGDPSKEGVRMGPLVGREQVSEVRRAMEAIQSEDVELVHGGFDNFNVEGDVERGAYYPISLLYAKNALKAVTPHSIEAFGPVNTIMTYKNLDEAIELGKLGKGSLVASLFTASNEVAKKIVHGVAPYHGRLVILNAECAPESTGHGSPLPHLVHGGPGRAGGGEEMGGIRGVLHYMQRTALQGSPTMLGAVCNEYIKGGAQHSDSVHPFRKHFEDLEIGETLVTAKRTITEEDILNFAELSGDKFYAHMDDEAARQSIFDGRVAHGYFIVSAAAGLFVDPAPGPVLANYGLEDLRFTKPVYPGDTIYVKLTCKRKTRKEDREDQIPQGVIAWDVEVLDQTDEAVAIYTILTLVKRRA